jgi:hypothetical protein
MHGLLIILVVVALRSEIAAVTNSLQGFKGIARRKAILSNQNTTTFLALLSYFLVATPALIWFFKAGANMNYTIEWFVTCTMLIGVTLFDSANVLSGMNCKDGRAKKNALKISAIGVPVIIAIHVFAVDLSIVRCKIDPNLNRVHMEELKKLTAIVRESHKPVISDDMVLLLRSGKSVEWEPFGIALNEKAGKWDGLPFEARIRQGDFSMFITEGKRGDVTFDERYTRAVSDAMDETYPVKRTIANLTLHLPSTAVTTKKRHL